MDNLSQRKTEIRNRYLNHSYLFPFKFLHLFHLSCQTIERWASLTIRKRVFMLLLGHFSQYGTTSIRTKLYVAAGMGEFEEITISNIKNKDFSLVSRNLI